MFGEGPDTVKQALEEVFDDTVPDGKVTARLSCRRHQFFKGSQPWSWWGSSILSLEGTGGREQRLRALQTRVLGVG